VIVGVAVLGAQASDKVVGQDVRCGGRLGAAEVAHLLDVRGRFERRSQRRVIDTASAYMLARERPPCSHWSIIFALANPIRPRYVAARPSP
jgi:hypothetical protein